MELRHPEPLQLTGNLASNWKRFKQKFDLFLQATTSKEHPRTESSKAALLLSVAGDDALDAFNTFQFVDGESQEDYETVVRKFEAYCSEVGNEVHERYLFHLKNQAEGEQFEKFLRDLKKQAEQCNFGDSKDSMVRDQIVFGTNDVKLREKLLQEKNLTLQKAEEMCKVAEVFAQRKMVWREGNDMIDAISKRTATKFRTDQQRQSRDYRCKKCNRQHKPRQCFAYGKRCNICNRLHHFAVCCPTHIGKDEVREVTEQGAESADDTFEILEVGNESRSGKDWKVTAHVSNQVVLFKVDTGSQANLLPFAVYRNGDRMSFGALKFSTSSIQRRSDQEFWENVTNCHCRRHH